MSGIEVAQGKHIPKKEDSDSKLKHMFAVHISELNKFCMVEPRRSQRPDMHGLILLDELFPSNSTMIIDEGMQDFSVKINYLDLARVLTDEHVLELVRCGFEYADYSIYRGYDGNE